MSVLLFPKESAAAFPDVCRLQTQLKHVLFSNTDLKVKGDLGSINKDGHQGFQSNGRSYISQKATVFHHTYIGQTDLSVEATSDGASSGSMNELRQKIKH